MKWNLILTLLMVMVTSQSNIILAQFTQSDLTKIKHSYIEGECANALKSYFKDRQITEWIIGPNKIMLKYQVFIKKKDILFSQVPIKTKTNGSKFISTINLKTKLWQIKTSDGKILGNFATDYIDKTSVNITCK